jgi:hypothetical protein
MIAIPLVGPIVKRTLSDKSVCHQLDVEIADPVRPERADNQLHERR